MSIVKSHLIHRILVVGMWGSHSWLQARPLHYRCWSVLASTAPQRARRL